MDALDGCPKVILGHTVKTRTQIVLTFLVPVVLELFVYVVLIPSDFFVVARLSIDGHHVWAMLTLAFIWLPAFLSFLVVLVTPTQWPVPTAYCNKMNFCYFWRLVLHLVFFPVAAIYRFSRRIFWSIEALVHDKCTPERHHAVTKAMETSPFELYHFLQAFVQSAPQIILQLHILLRENMFRNYDTTTAQVISIVFSLIQMAMIVMSFQRFESQKIVGRTYPWHSAREVQSKQKTLRQSTMTVEEVQRRRSQKVITPVYPRVLDSLLTGAEDEERQEDGVELRKTMNIEPQNFDRPASKEATRNFTDDKKFQLQKVEVTAEVTPYREKLSDEVDSAAKRTPGRSTHQNVTDDDLIENVAEMEEYLRLNDDTFSASTTSENERGSSFNFERTPSFPAPPRPTSVFPHIPGLNRLSTFKDMLIFNTEQLIKENVPRLPARIFEHHHHPATTRRSFVKEDKEEKKSPPPADEVDFIMPTRQRMIEGLEQDDIVGKYVSLFGWYLFLLMRMLSLAVFSVFYIIPCTYLCLAHYIVMLAAIFYETKLHEKIERNLFHFGLAYVYIFCVLEFKIKFIHLRAWFVGYFVFVFSQNVAITLVWYHLAQFQSWWFYFMFDIIIGSGVLSLSCLTFYYFLLRPRDKVLFVNE